MLKRLLYVSVMSIVKSIDTFYAIAVVSGREQSTITKIKNKLSKKGLLKPHMEFICPDEEVIFEKNGNRESKRKLTLPGYVLLRCRGLSEDAIFQIDHTPGVMEFLGGSEDPQPVPLAEVRQMLGDTVVVNSKTVHAMSEGDLVEVKAGSMQGFTGTILEFNEAKTKAKVNIEIFGRATPTQVNVDQLRKAA